MSVPTECCDVVVVGAGPAGSVTALELARRGHHVVLLDRRSFPRPKPCGDCLSPAAALVLDSLGLLDAVEALAPARLAGWRIHSPGGDAFAAGFDGAAGSDARVRTSIAVSRERLDDVLLRAAVDAGVELHAPVRVENLLADAEGVRGVVVAGGHTIRARLVIGADGLRSVVARRADSTLPPGRLRKLSLTIHARLPRDFTRGFGEMHVVPDGCIGIAPVGADAEPLHNLTFVRAARARGEAARLQPTETMLDMVRSAAALADRREALVAAIQTAGPPLASGPFDRPVRFVVRDGLALVGDAAGYYDPFTGQGVYQAMSGGMHLADVADRALRARSGQVRVRELRPYARWLRATWRPARAVQRSIEYVTARPALMGRLVRAIEAAPAFGDTLIAVTGDVVPARRLIGSAVVPLTVALLRNGTTH